jgi:hypothetical protein
MPARVPLDVDLEDKLLYGLTPTRLGYLLIALLTAFALWSSQGAPTPVRAAAALLVIGIGAVMSWGRWRGRRADIWILDIALFAVRTHRVMWNVSWPRFRENSTSKKPSSASPAETLTAAA